MKRKYGTHAVEITHPDKVLLAPEITKGMLIDYYEAIADRMVPYMKNRALMMHRFPEGIDGESFYQKDASVYFPEWIKKAQIPKKGGYTTSVICQNKATLVYLANQACITPHLWLSRIDKLNNPDRLIIDLDPSTNDFSLVVMVACTFKELFDSLGLTSFAMTTGSKGIHISVPLDRALEFHEVKDFALQCAQIIVDAHPTLATLEISKEQRGDKVFIDTLRNHYGATAVSPYAVRAIKHAPVATPLAWKELADKRITPQSFTISNIFQRLERIEDPWQEFLKLKQSLKKARRWLAT